MGLLWIKSNRMQPKGLRGSLVLCAGGTGQPEGVMGFSNGCGLAGHPYLPGRGRNDHDHIYLLSIGKSCRLQKRYRGTQ